MGTLMGSKSPSTVTQTNETVLTPEGKALSAAAGKEGLKFANANYSIPNYTVAGFTPAELEAQSSALAAARGNMTTSSTAAMDANNYLMNPALLDPGSNPWLAAQGDAITKTMTDNLLEQVMPALRAGSITAAGINSGGNTRRGIAEGQAVGRTQEQIGNSLNTLYGNAYAKGLDTMGAAVGRNNDVLKGLLVPSTVMSGVGAQQREMQQAQNDAAMENAWMQQMAPFLKAQQLAALASGLPGSKGVSSTTGATPQTSTGGKLLGGAATGASIGSVIPGVGTTAGAGLGALLSFL
jgi:hypothetical protein